MSEGKDQLIPTMALEETTPVFRPAEPREDAMLSRILCNAFLPLWNHNWFHQVSEPLEPIDVLNTEAHMSDTQKSRLRFYRALISHTRLLGGSVIVADVTSIPKPTNTGKTSDPASTRDIGAILLWLPPEKRLSALPILTLYRSGFLALMLPWNYGLTGLYRIQFVFEENIQNMWSRVLPELPPHGFKEQDCGFVQMLAANPKCAGKGYASKLLKYQVGQHFAEFPDRPAILDTTTVQGTKAYERLGFKVLGEIPVDTGTDARGIKLKQNASEEVKKEASKICVQKIMAKLPGSPI